MRIMLGISLLISLCTLSQSFIVLPQQHTCSSSHQFQRGVSLCAAAVETRSPPVKKRSRRSQSGYMQDPRDDRTAVEEDAEAVYRLLEDRANARREQDWKKADRLLERLQTNHNVQVFDGQVRVYSRQGSAPLNVLKERYDKHYGPNCHPYTHVGAQELDPISCPVTMNDVHNALCRRLWLKSEKRYFEADAQLYELMTYGIEVNDGLKQWRSDGKVVFAKEWSKPPTRALAYKEITSLELTERTRLRIMQLIKQRANALARTDTNLVDILQYELYKTYQVTINDFDQTWQQVAANSGDDENGHRANVVPPFKNQITSHLPTLAALDPEHNWAKGGPYRCNSIVSAGTVLSPSEDARVLFLLMQRDELRSIGHFIEADSIVDELWKTYQVDPHDVQRQYSVGQKFDDYDERVASSVQQQQQPVVVVAQQGAAVAGGGSIKKTKPFRNDDSTTTAAAAAEVPRWWEAYKESGVAKDLENKASEVENLIKYLSTQQQRNPNIVDRLMVRLEEEYGLLFDGATWKLKGKMQQYPPVASLNQECLNLSPLELGTIQELVDKRNEEMFQLKNKSMGEILEAGLRSKYNIVIDDETQSWYLSD
eukprot:CAMPEP_0119013540 /NCGR_PEP_ID=MMETSP1176-20130426/8502_1 /TAXON_ID=265551 /ORGANISM="Synedropsis recta cf, Strain CCMP1620" /LENGTH=596 /DNA_ID=CAMNT_0006966637 /DNA_START=28 /DNA_END=1818 /DNA_ORIENTATION=+